MGAKPLTPSQAAEAVAVLAACYGNTTTAARKLNIPRSTMQSRVDAARRMGIAMEPLEPPEPAAPEPPEPLALSFEEAWQNWMRAIGMAKDRYVPKVGTHVPESGTRKILVVPDLHAPFHEEAMFAAMLEREADADHVVCIGDLGDAYALSRFMKYERMPYRDEWASVNLCMQEMATRFPTVEIVIGNHDARLEKQLRTHLTEDMVDAVQLLTGGILCPITAMSRRYPNVTIAHHTTPGGQAIDWFTTVGDAWLGHPEKYSRVAGSALRFLEDWISDNEHTLGIGGARLIVMGHTHTAAIIPYRADKLLVECGCLCLQQGYMLSPRIGGRPQRRGYVTFEQADGKTDLNSVRFVWFDAMGKAA
jgi:UDP-2,3-diacylglucosamine pyrophosphatase LpxH